MERVEEKAYAKLNLTLGVLFKRMDGYHALDTLMQTVSLFDRVTVAPAKTVEVHVTGAELPYENTLYKAAKLYQARCGKGALITCEKRLPSEAGMGGGSADAAAVLRGLQRLHRMLTDRELREIALQVGADVPFCLQGGLCRCEGVGEILTPVVGPLLHFAVVKPPQGVSTKALFQSLSLPRKRVETVRCLAKLGQNDLPGAAAYMENALEAPAVTLVPEIGEIKTALLQKGALAACMTGSGSAVFGLFEKEEQAQAALTGFPEEYYTAVCHSV
ncbi:MAG: 4-(cytidine 5'-diphospho)-2-C-methyl-D-erythritol kinase [Clostridia bacterium]|nr:4-(cytidine 5'-diphospho)-2-C-methyl-D-erythritol kinase [Clostridia bacterium]